MTTSTITSERIDDIPLLVHWLHEMQVDTTIDAVLGPPHGNRQGLSSGHLAVVFLAYILSTCNHFLSPVRDWVAKRHHCLEHALGQPIRETDCTDDRLEDLLDALGADLTRTPIDGPTVWPRARHGHVTRMGCRGLRLPCDPRSATHGYGHGKGRACKKRSGEKADGTTSSRPRPWHPIRALGHGLGMGTAQRV